MTFATKVWLGVGVFAVLYFSLLYWCLYVFPGTQVQTVTTYREVDVSRLEGKRSAPGKLAPETVQRQEIEASVEIFKTGRDPFERVK